MPGITFEIKEHFGTLSVSDKGWAKELNLVSWNGREAKYDIREWSPEHDKMNKGTTMTEAEIKALKGILNEEF